MNLNEAAETSAMWLKDKKGSEPYVPEVVRVRVQVGREGWGMKTQASTSQLSWGQLYQVGVKDYSSIMPASNFLF